MKFEDIKPGMTLYDCRMQTGMIRGIRDACTWRVYVKETDSDKRRVFCSWNGNPAEWLSWLQVKAYRKEPRKVINSRFGSRFATRAEEKSMKVSR